MFFVLCIHFLNDPGNVLVHKDVLMLYKNKLYKESYHSYALTQRMYFLLSSEFILKGQSGILQIGV